MIVVDDTQDHVQVRGQDSVLEELQRAVSEHAKILQRQEALIRRLRDELKDVRR